MRIRARANEPAQVVRRGFAYAVCVALCRASSSSSPSSSSSSSVSSHAHKKKWITLSSPSVPWTCHVLSGVFLMADGFGDCRARADSHSTAAGVARGHLECKVARDGVFLCVCVCVISRGVARAATASARDAIARARWATFRRHWVRLSPGGSA